MKIIPLSEGSFTIDQTKRFIPFNLVSDDLQERSRGSLLVEIQPFAVITGEDILLLDTGLGFRDPDGVLQIHRSLVNAGINPMDVTKVLMSHLHKDHAGGVAARDEVTGQYFLSFPSATYYVQRRELAYALEKGAPSYMPEELLPLQGTDKVVLLDGDEGSIGLDGGIKVRYQVTGGHSVYHQVFWIEGKNEAFFFGGDDAPQLSQMKNKIVAKYDFDGKKSMELRRKWWDEASQEHWTLLFYHDIKYPLLSL